MPTGKEEKNKRKKSGGGSEWEMAVFGGGGVHGRE